MSKLNLEILKIIKTKTGMSSDQAVRNAVSDFKNKKCPRATQNAAAQLFAQSRGFSIAKKLKKEDKETLPSNVEFERPVKIKINCNRPRHKKIVELLKFDTQDYFLKKHIEEINRAYTFACYTSVYVLCRKVIENLLIDILRKKYPEKKLTHKSLYFDTQRSKFLDLRDILKNLLIKTKEFGPEESLIKRLVEKSREFKEDANKKTHSLWHIVTNKREIDNKNPQEILELIKSLNARI